MLHTESIGKGDVLLFLHSGGETGRTDYQDQKTFFSINYNVVMVDMSGHGYSTIRDYSNAEEFMEASIADLYETISRLGISPCHIVASSSSAMIAVILGKRHPEIIRTLTISGIVPNQTEEMKQMMEMEQDNKEALFLNEEVTQVLDERHGENDWRKFVRLTFEPNWYPFSELKDLTPLKEKPVCCIVGEELMPEVDGISYYKRHFENVHTAIIPFASHLVHRDQPQLFNAVYQTFLNQYNRNDESR